MLDTGTIVVFRFVLLLRDSLIELLIELLLTL